LGAIAQQKRAFHVMSQQEQIGNTLILAICRFSDRGGAMIFLILRQPILIADHEPPLEKL
jgi:hypothetical protein